MKFIKRIILFALIFCGVALVGLGIYVGTQAASAQLDTDRLVDHERGVKMLAIDGTDISDRNSYTLYKDISPDLVNAFVAVEDKRFWDHNGLDGKRIVGAAIANVKNRNFGQGASTITCQLVKNTHLDQSKTFSRKIREAKLALEVEKQFSKEEIMEMYLNVIYFGQGLYGVGAAANGFFGKSPKELTLSECACLAATVVNPAKYSLRLEPQNNKTRRNMVLDLMCEQGYINQTDKESAQKEQINLVDQPDDPYRPYRTNALLEAAELSGIDAVHLIGGGYTINTYCDPSEQKRASSLLGQDLISVANDRTNPDCMLITLDATGHVRSFASSTALPLFRIRRSPGSVIKPFVYAAAIEQNLLLPASPILDEPTTFGDYAPHNYRDVYYGQITASKALAKSSNVAAVKTLTYVGIDRVYEDMLALGLPLTKEDKHLGLALGGLTEGVTMQQLGGAYCAIENDGLATGATMIESIVDDEGKVIYKNENNPTRVYSPQTTFLLKEMMAQAVTDGTAHKLDELGGVVFAKTGTVDASNGNSDAWCVALSGDTVAISWVGNLSMDHDKMITTTGGGDTALLTRELLRGHVTSERNIPDGIKSVEIDRYEWDNLSVLSLASANTPDQYREKTFVKQDSLLYDSTSFEITPSVVPTVKIENNRIKIKIEGAPICSYKVEYDLGFWKYSLDELTGQEIEVEYPVHSGYYTITPILHGKRDIIGQPYRVWIY